MIKVETFPHSEMLRGMYLEQPVNGAALRTSGLEVSGWLLGAEAPAIAVEVKREDEILHTIPVSCTRDDIAADYPRIRYSRLCGFAANFNGAKIGVPGELKLNFRLKEGSSIPFARLTLEEESPISSLGAKAEIDAIISSGDSPVLGSKLDSPRCGPIGGYALKVSGWALGSSKAVKEVRLTLGEEILGKFQCCLPRPDIAGTNNKKSWAALCGFSGEISVLGLPRNFTLHVSAFSADGRKTKIAEIIGRRQALPASASGLKPLLIGTVGRSGSTWVVNVLSQHPQLLAYRPFHCEPRLLSYWLDIVKSLSEPRSMYQALAGELTKGSWWTGQDRNSFTSLGALAPELEQWLTSDQVDDLLIFAQQRIVAFYAKAAAAQGLSGANYFVEKCWPESSIPMLASELFPGSRELLLVRDFRDVLASILAFNKKLGYHSFGREAVQSDLEFVKLLKTYAEAIWKAWEVRRNSAHLLKYEDFMQAPIETLTDLCFYLDIDPDRSVVEGCFERARKNSPQEQKWHITSTNAEASLNRWRRDLSPALQRACDEQLGEVLIAFGYR